MWDAFKDWIFSCIQFFSNFVGDWGLAIIIITVIFRLIVAPIMHKQIKSSFQILSRKFRRSSPTIPFA